MRAGKILALGSKSESKQFPLSVAEDRVVRKEAAVGYSRRNSSFLEA